MELLLKMRRCNCSSTEYDLQNSPDFNIIACIPHSKSTHQNPNLSPNPLAVNAPPAHVQQDTRLVVSSARWAAARGERYTFACPAAPRTTAARASFPRGKRRRRAGARWSTPREDKAPRQWPPEVTRSGEGPRKIARPAARYIWARGRRPPPGSARAGSGDFCPPSWGASDRCAYRPSGPGPSLRLRPLTGDFRVSTVQGSSGLCHWENEGALGGEGEVEVDVWRFWCGWIWADRQIESFW